jgi:hypothetical protein
VWRDATFSDRHTHGSGFNTNRLMKKGAKRTKRIGVEDTVLGVASARTTRNAAKRRPRMHHAPERRMNKGGQIRGLWWPATRIIQPKRTGVKNMNTKTHKVSFFTQALSSKE